MATSLHQTIEFPECLRHHKQLLVTSDDLNNSVFVLNNLLQALARNSLFRSKGKAMFVLLNQSYLNLSCVQMKSGLNLKPLKESSQLIFIDLISDYGTFYSDGCFRSTQFAEHLLQQVDLHFKDKQDNEYNVLAIDDLSVLLSLGMSLPDLHLLVQQLRLLCHRHHVCLLIQTYQDGEQEDDQLDRAVLLLKANSSLCLQVNKLTTGYSKSVDGNLFVTDYLKNGSQRFLFKCTERTAKLTHSLS
jgi:hypothetical protein